MEEVDWTILIRFCVFARLGENFDAVRAEAAFGVAHYIQDGHFHVDNSTSRPHELNLYRSRLYADDDLTVHSGIGSHDVIPDVVSWNLPVIGFREFTPLVDFNTPSDVEVAIPADWNFGLDFRSTQVPELLAQYRWYSPDLPAATTLLLWVIGVMHATTMSGPMQSDVLMHSFWRYGFVVIPKAFVIDMLESGLREKSEEVAHHYPLENTSDWTAEDVIEMCHLGPTLHPLKPGPILHDVGLSHYLVDLATASSRVIHGVSPASSGDEMSDARARHFEDNLQRAIDDSAWKPSADLQARVRREIRSDSAGTITDLDAIAVLDGTVLLIDAKSYVRPSSHAGDYAVIRNIRTDLQDAVVKWRTQVEAIVRENLIPLHTFKHVIPLIVTAAPHFVHLSLIEPRYYEKKLSPVVSFNEFVRFLQLGAPAPPLMDDLLAELERGRMGVWKPTGPR